MDEADKGVVGREYRGRSGPCRRLIPPTGAPDAQLAPGTASRNVPGSSILESPRGQGDLE